MKSSSGDNWDALSTQFCSVAKYVNDGDYNKAHKALDEIIVPMEKKYGRITEQIACLYKYKGYLYKEEGNLDGFLQCSDISIEIYNLVKSNCKTEEIERNMDIAYIHEKRNNPDKANKFYDCALSLCKDCLESREIKEHDVINYMADIYYYTNEYESSIRCIQALLKLEDASSYDNKQLYCYLSKLYIYLKDYDRAIDCYRMAISCCIDELPIRNKDELIEAKTNLVNIYICMGNTYYLDSRFSDAITIYEIGLRIIRRCLVRNNKELENVYDGIGNAYWSLLDYKNAIKYFMKQARLRKKLYGSRHINTCGSYNSVGLINRDMGDYGEALAFFKMALKYARKSSSFDKTMLAVYYNNVGITYLDIGENDLAFANIKKAIEILETVHEESQYKSRFFNNMGMVYQANGELKTALEYYEKALALCIETGDSENSNMAKVFCSLCSFYIAKGEYEIAVEYGLRSYGISSICFVSDHPFNIKVRKYIREAYAALGMPLESFNSWLETANTESKAKVQEERTCSLLN
jgi:tetratricopeptide (TPR) repeat protein